MNIEEMKKRKVELGYSNERLSVLSGVPISTIQKIFSGTTMKPRYETLLALERVLSSKSRFSETAFQYMAKPQGEYTREDLEAFPVDACVELIDGVLYDMSGATHEHQLITFNIGFQLKKHVIQNKGTCSVTVAPCDVHLQADDSKTAVQPDVFVVCDKSKISRKNIEGAPDLVVEVLSPSTKKKDYTIKFLKYSEAGVREYWLVDPDNQKVIVYLLGDDINTFLYTFDDKIPVAIWGNECYVDMNAIKEELDFLYK